MPRATTSRNITAFATTLDGLGVRWRKTPPVRVEWYKPPLRRTLPLLRYAVNPGKTMILKIMVLPADAQSPASISVALFQHDGRFMLDTSFDLDNDAKALDWLQYLFAEKFLVKVADKNGQWAGSCCGGPKARLSTPKLDYAFTRSWLGTYDAP